jgi:hypothetical protein
MIQRIQSLYLLCSAVLIIAATCFNFATFSFDDYEIVFSPYTIRYVPEVAQTQTMPSLSVSLWLTAACTLVTIFLYKKRKLQIRIIRYICIFKFALCACVAFFMYLLATNDATGSMHIEVSVLLLVISIIIDILAFIAIRKDERLVRSIDRIR